MQEGHRGAPRNSEQVACMMFPHRLALACLGRSARRIRRCTSLLSARGSYSSTFLLYVLLGLIADGTVTRPGRKQMDLFDRAAPGMVDACVPRIAAGYLAGRAARGNDGRTVVTEPNVTIIRHLA